jgi:hypothetical protein
MPIAPLLQRFVDDELARSTALIERTLASALQVLGETRTPTLSGAERAHQGQLAESLRRHAGAYVGAFIEALRTEVQAALREQHDDALPATHNHLASLELMDESQVEVDIEISRAMQVIDSAAEWELRELQMFTSTLTGRSHVSPDSNPLRPIVYATALWHAACATTPQHAPRATLLRVSAAAMASLLKNEWAAACTRLEAQGIEPGVYRSVVLVPGSLTDRIRSAEETRRGNLNSLLATLPGRSASHAAETFGAGSGSAGSAMAPQEFEEALRRLDELLRQIPAEPSADRSAATSLLARLTEQRSVLAASAGAVDEQVIELLSRLFETVLSDPQLHPSFRPVLARLQVSALRVALRDPSMMEGVAHPVWQLMDRLADASAAFPQLGDPRLAALLAFGQALAEDLAQSPTPDAALYRRGLARLDAFLGEQLQQQISTAQASIDALGRTERRNLLERQLSQRLSDEVSPLHTSASVRRFITGPWARVLAESILRFGEEGQATRGYTKAIEDLIWSVRPPDHPQSRQRLVALLPGLLQQLRSGMAMIDLAPAEQQTLLDELMQIHTEALRRGPRPAAQPTAEEIVQRLRDEVVPAASDNRGFADSVIDLASMQTVPAELMDAIPAAPEPSHEVEAMAAGRRYRLFLQGRWSRAQLLWRSPQGQLFLFAGENPGRNHSVTRRALERLEEAGLVKPHSEAPLIQRSVNSLRRQLALPG